MRTLHPTGTSLLWDHLLPARSLRTISEMAGKRTPLEGTQLEAGRRRGVLSNDGRAHTGRLLGATFKPLTKA